MAKNKPAGQPEDMTPEQEREYWDAQDPLRQGKRVRLRRIEPSPARLSYFALRLSGKDITRLSELAQKQGMKPSELARALILRGLEQNTQGQDLERRLELLEKQVSEITKSPATSTAIEDVVLGRSDEF